MKSNLFLNYVCYVYIVMGRNIVVCAEPHGSFICGWDSCLQSEDNGLYLTPDTERVADVCRIYQDSRTDLQSGIQW